MPASVAPPFPYANTIIATHVAHSALLKVANAASRRRRAGFRATTARTPTTASGYDRTRPTTGRPRSAAVRGTGRHVAMSIPPATPVRCAVVGRRRRTRAAPGCGRRPRRVDARGVALRQLVVAERHGHDAFDGVHPVGERVAGSPEALRRPSSANVRRRGAARRRRSTRRRRRRRPTAWRLDYTIQDAARERPVYRSRKSRLCVWTMATLEKHRASVSDTRPVGLTRARPSFRPIPRVRCRARSG